MTVTVIWIYVLSVISWIALISSKSIVDELNPMILTLHSVPKLQIVSTLYVLVLWEEMEIDEVSPFSSISQAVKETVAIVNSSNLVLRDYRHCRCSMKIDGNLVIRSDLIGDYRNGTDLGLDYDSVDVDNLRIHSMNDGHSDNLGVCCLPVLDRIHCFDRNHRVHGISVCDLIAFH